MFRSSLSSAFSSNHNQLLQEFWACTCNEEVLPLGSYLQPLACHSTDCSPLPTDLADLVHLWSSARSLTPAVCSPCGSYSAPEPTWFFSLAACSPRGSYSAPGSTSARGAMALLCFSWLQPSSGTVSPLTVLSQITTGATLRHLFLSFSRWCNPTPTLAQSRVNHALSGIGPGGYLTAAVRVLRPINCPNCAEAEARFWELHCPPNTAALLKLGPGIGLKRQREFCSW